MSDIGSGGEIPDFASLADASSSDRDGLSSSPASTTSASSNNAGLHIVKGPMSMSQFFDDIASVFFDVQIESVCFN